MGRQRSAGQGDLLGLMVPGPMLPATVRAQLTPLIAALVLEAAGTGTMPEAMVREGGDEQDHA